MDTIPWYKYSKRNYYNQSNTVRFKPWLLPLGIAIFSLVIAVCGTVVIVNRTYTINKSLDAQYQLAKNAPSATLTAGYLDRLDAGLVARHATSGHTALVFKTDANDIRVYRYNLTQLRERARQVAAMAPADVSYQYAVTNLKTAVSNLGTLDGGLLWVRYWWLYFLLVFGYVVAAVALIWTIFTVHNYRY